MLRRIGLRPQLLVLMLGDAVAVQVSALLVFTLRSLMGPLNTEMYCAIAILLFLEPVFSVFLGSCQSIALPPHKEVKQLFLAVTLTYLVVLAALFATQTGEQVSRLVIMGAWTLSIFMVPVVRGRLRRWLSDKTWWTRPLIFLQQGADVDVLWQSLETHPQRGLRPVAALGITPGDADASLHMRTAVEAHPGAVGLLCLDAAANDNPDFIKEASSHFSSLLLVPRITMGGKRFWLTPRDLESAVGLLVRQNLLDTRRLRIKRCIDVLLTLLSSVAVVPVAALLALAIRLDSPGPVIYAQWRIGQNGQRFRVYKFRTMVRDADTLLQQHLARHPRLQKEWEEDQKLRHDPRITRMGKLLRKTSLDELPQLWNVLMGSMSLVGPRPIVEEEVSRYGRVYKEYTLVKPGITGLWQVSGRNNTTYTQRVEMDHYYVNNWSVWMDLWILARTVPVVAGGAGAY